MAGWMSSCSVGELWRAFHLALAIAFYRNNRDGTFTDVTEKAGLLDPARLGLRRLRGRL